MPQWQRYILFILKETCYLRTLGRGGLCVTCPQRTRSLLPMCLHMCITSCFCTDKCGEIKLEGEPETKKKERVSIFIHIILNFESSA